MKTIKILFLAALLIAITGCKKDDSNPAAPSDNTPSKLVLGSAYNNGTKITIYADDSLAVGYHKLYVAVTDSATGKAASSGHITITPMMQMTTMSHSSPVEQPDTLAIAGLFTGASVFTMPTILPDDTWKVQVEFHNHQTDKEGKISIPVIVKSSTKMSSFVASDSSKLFVTFLPIAKPQVGINDIEFTVHKKASMMSFPAVDDITLEMTPDMPSMGHGSPNNVNPILTAKGHYKGKVNFTMTGEWRITVLIKKGTVTLGTTSFYITL